MATNFPNSLDEFQNPTASTAMNDPVLGHASQHANVNDAIEALEAKVGVNSSAVQTSLDFRVTALEALDVSGFDARITAEENRTIYTGVTQLGFAVGGTSSGGTYTGATISDYTNTVHADAVWHRVKNASGGTLMAGTPVRLTGYNAGEDAFEIAAGDNTTSVCFGVLQTAIANGVFGMVVVAGTIHNVDTSAFAVGTILYPNSSGGWTSTPPTTGYQQPLAYVLRQHANNGHLQVLADYPKQSADDVRYLTGGSATTVEAALNALRAGTWAMADLTILNTARMKMTDSQGGATYYGWRDLIGDVTPKTTGAGAPTLDTLTGNVRAFRYSVGDDGDITFHLPHDYVPGTDLYLHPHWTHNGTSISGSFAVDFYFTYAKGHQQANFHTQKTLTITDGSLNITNTPTLRHRIPEAKISTPGGSASQLDTDLLEVDGIIVLHYDVATIPTISGGTSTEPFILTLDIHYQSTGVPTKNKAPNFYS